MYFFKIVAFIIATLSLGQPILEFSKISLKNLISSETFFSSKTKPMLPGRTISANTLSFDEMVTYSMRWFHFDLAFHLPSLQDFQMDSSPRLLTLWIQNFISSSL